MKGNIHILNEALVMLPSSIAQIQKGRSKLFGVFQFTPQEPGNDGYRLIQGGNNVCTLLRHVGRPTSGSVHQES